MNYFLNVPSNICINKTLIISKNNLKKQHDNTNRIVLGVNRSTYKCFKHLNSGQAFICHHLILILY